MIRTQPSIWGQITGGTLSRLKHTGYLLSPNWEQWTIDITPDPSCIRKRSVVIAGHRTSITLENAFWDHLKAIAARKGETLNSLVTRIDAERTGNMSSALRVFILEELSP